MALYGILIKPSTSVDLPHSNNFAASLCVRGGGMNIEPQVQAGSTIFWNLATFQQIE